MHFCRFKATFKQIELPILSVCNKSVNWWLTACCHHALSLDGFIFSSLSFSMDIITYKLVPPSCCSGRYHGEYLGPAWKLLNEHKLTIFEKKRQILNSVTFMIHSSRNTLPWKTLMAHQNLQKAKPQKISPSKFQTSSWSLTTKEIPVSCDTWGMGN